MSDDIVDRLWEGVWYHGGDASVLLNLAADEIKRLRAERDRLRDGIARHKSRVTANKGPGSTWFDADLWELIEDGDQ